jgi:tripartite-type tricarboxylate transporter receptor subunit TctC
MRSTHGILPAACAAVAFLATPVPAAEIFQGKTISVIVGFGPGGGYDTNARLLARHMAAKIPGKPTMVVKNMPGAGSLKSVQHLSTTAPKDGTTIVTFNFGQITSSRVMPNKKIQVDFRDFAWIGSISRDLSVCYVRKGIGGDSLANLAKRDQVNFGLTSPGSASFFNQTMLRGVFGVKLKQIAGYSGSKGKQLAIERGELDGDCGAWSSVPDDWLKNNKIDVLLRYSPLRPDDMPASIPYALDLAKSDDDRKIIILLTGAAELGRPYIAPKALAPDRLAIFRTAFAATMKDAAFSAEAKKQGLPVSPIIGADAEKTLSEIYNMPPEVVAKAKGLIKR